MSDDGGVGRVADRDHGMGGYGARYNRLSYADTYVQMSEPRGEI